MLDNVSRSVFTVAAGTRDRRAEALPLQLLDIDLAAFPSAVSLNHDPSTNI